jgi:hypothetical protein
MILETSVMFFAYHTVLTDYHWDCLTFLSSYTPPLRTDYDSAAIYHDSLLVQLLVVLVPCDLD